MDKIPNPRVQTVLQAIRKDAKRLRHLLFQGPPGSGKTSTAQIFIQSWQPDGKIPPGATLFLNASDERGLESIRERVFPFLSSCNLLPEHAHLPRFLVFDEAETLTSSAQLALRNILEKAPVDFCCILFLVNTISGVEKSLQHRFLRIRFDPLPSECLAERVKLQAPDRETPTPLDAVRLRGDLRIFLHAPNAAQQLARNLWEWLHEKQTGPTNFTQKTLEDLQWICAIFGVLDDALVVRITHLSQPGVIRVMSHDLYQKHIHQLKDIVLQKIEGAAAEAPATEAAV